MTYSYTWMNLHDLAGQNNAWLKNACKERRIKTTGLRRMEMQAALLTWHQELQDEVTEEMRDG